jgi:hypothetical protein
VAFKISFCFLLPDAWSGVEVSEDWSFPFIDINLFLLHYILFRMFFTELDAHLFLQSLHLSFQFSHTIHLLTSEHNFLDENSGFSVFGEVDGRYAVGQVEIEPQRGVLSLIVFDDALKDADVERDVLSVDGEEDGIIFAIDID